MRDFLKDSKDIIDSLAEASRARKQLDKLRKDKESKEFMRLSKQTVKGDFFDAEKEIRALYNLAKNGTDYNRKRMQDLIKKLQKIDKSAALYSDRKSVPKNYQ